MTAPTEDRGDELDTATPARDRLATDLLGWREERPAAPAGLATRLLSELEAGLAELRGPLAEVAAGRRNRTVMITKTSLSRMVCDGWQLDPLPYTHTLANARGTLAHEAIAVDWARQRQDAAAELVERVWHEVATRRAGDPASLSAFLNTLPIEQATALRSEVADLVDAFREVWPPLPADAVLSRVERPLAVRLAGGLVTLRGVPDLVLCSPREDERARTLVVDLKTGMPRSEHDRHELRFYALLETLTTGKPPFRWGTYYVTEGRAEVEDLREATLEVTARRVLDGVRQAIRLGGDDGRETDLTIAAGSWCRFCRREDHCETALAARSLDAGGHGG
jgi:hypothetical protein